MRVEILMTTELTYRAEVEVDSLEDAQSIYYGDLSWDTLDEFTWPLEYKVLDDE